MTTHVVREGEHAVGVHFVACHAPYLARGWIKQLQMIEPGPQSFQLHFNRTAVASTTNGIITRENFFPGVLDDISRKTRVDDLFLKVPDHGDYFNMTYQTRVEIVTAEPPTRQNYFIRQTWAQILRKKKDSDTNSDMDFEEVPCIVAFNLRSQDSNAKIYRTTPLAVVV